MIITKLQGGLGNQLFQWAFGKAVSLSLNEKEFYLDDAFYENQQGVTHRNFELNKFIIILIGKLNQTFKNQ